MYKTGWWAGYTLCPRALFSSYYTYLHIHYFALEGKAEKKLQNWSQLCHAFPTKWSYTNFSQENNT